MRTGLIFFFLLLYVTGFAQLKQVTGKITYISSQLVYVQFENTRGIQAGDTLFISGSTGKQTPVLIVKYTSSRSLACEPFANITLQPGTSVFGNTREITQITTMPSGIDSQKNNASIPVVSQVKSRLQNDSPRIRGRLTLQSSSDFTADSRYNSNRYRGTLNLTADDAFVKGLTLTNYMTYSLRDKEWAVIKSNPLQNLRVYDAAGIYTFDSIYQITAGRHLNYKMSGIGAIDGVQFEVQQKPVSYGFAIGSHPEFTDYGVNLKLFQLGAYISQQQKTTDGEYENTLAVFNQTNNFITDRRFLYFQHTNNLLPKTYLYFSNETDLYEVKNGAAKTSFRMTGLFVMVRYTPLRELSAGLSYDARRNVVYYETYKTLLENLYTNAIRQGLRLSITGRPSQQLTIGLNSGYRFQKGDPKASQDYGTYIYYNGLPFVEADIAGNFSYISSAYLKGGTADISVTKNYLDLYAQVGYRLFNSKYIATNHNYNQGTMYGSVSYPLTNTITASCNYEGVFESSGNSQRVFIDISTRF